MKENMNPNRQTSTRHNKNRIDAIDYVRGFAMAIMVIDHARRSFYGSVEPLNFESTTIALFLTRWITHFCAPAFIFLSGCSVFLSATKLSDKHKTSKTLIKRGLFLIGIDLFVLNGSLDFSSIGLGVLWAIGWSMIFLSFVIHLPIWLNLAIASILIAGHNLTDHISSEYFGPVDFIWTFLHEGGIIEYAPGFSLKISYPVIPWIGLMSVGYAFGKIIQKERNIRRAFMLKSSILLFVSFFVLRFFNLYGDPLQWSPQSSHIYTFLSFINCHKYPPSLLFLLVNMALVITMLYLFDRPVSTKFEPIKIFGRVPLIFYILHLFLLKFLSIIFNPLLPSDNKHGLITTYLITAVVITILYPICIWYASYKKNNNHLILRYL